MDKNILAVIVVAAVAALALLMRRGAKRSEAITDAGTRRAGEAREPAASPMAAEPDEDEPAEAGAFTSDGWAFVPDGHEVQLVPPAAAEDLLEAMGRAGAAIVDRNTGALDSDLRHRALPGMKPGEHFDAGDLTGVRVVRGAPDVDPWRLEALGREGEYRAWAFETEDAARTAMGLLERRIVRAPLGEDGAPAPPVDADYVAALAITQAGVADLAVDGGDDEPRT
jgi:hypothetical protein